MRKLFIIMAVIASALTVSAQRASDSDMRWANSSDINHSGFVTDITAGVLTGDLDTDFALGVKLGYRWNIYDGLSWDIVSIGASTGVSNFAEAMNLRFLSGFRYNTPVDLIGKSLYVNFGLGYCLSTDETDFGGFAYEVGAGVNFTRTLSFGIVWEGSNWSYESEYDYWKISGKFGTIGLRLGLNF